MFTPIWGRIQFDEHIFQMGWFNHQLEEMVDWLNSMKRPSHASHKHFINDDDVLMKDDI